MIPGITPKNTNFSKATLADLLSYHKNDVALDINCHAIGTIQTFNAVLQTATATINYQKVIYMEQSGGQFGPVLVSYPVLVDCPVKYPFGSKGGFTHPYAQGDEVWVEFNDRDLDAWFAGQINQAPFSARLHSFTDAIISGSVKSTPNVLADFDADRPMVRDVPGTSYIALNPANGKTQVTNPNGNLATILQSILSHLESLSNACAALTVTAGTSLIAPSGGGPVTGVSGTPVNAATFTTLASDLTTDATNLGKVLE